MSESSNRGFEGEDIDVAEDLNSSVGTEISLSCFDEDEGWISTDEHAETSANKSLCRGESWRKSKTVLKVPLVRCHMCSRPYQTLDGYVSHIKLHAVEDLYTNAPGFAAVIVECRNLSSEVLTCTDYLQPDCGMTNDIKTLAKAILSLPEEVRFIFTDHVAEILWQCFPAPTSLQLDAFHSECVKGSQMFLSNLKRRNALLETLKELLRDPSFSMEVSQWFIAEFVRKMSAKLEVFYLRCLREPYNILLSSPRTDSEDRDDLVTLDFQQCVHYVDGSVVRSMMRMPMMSTKNKRWSDIHECVQTRFLEGTEVSGPGADIQEWTESRDRGGLKHISENVWCFLKALSGVLKTMERSDGGLIHGDVYSHVCNDDILMLLWSSVINSALNEDDCNLLLMHLCKFFVNAWGRGIALTRKNSIDKVSRDKVPLRSHLSV